MSIFFCTFHQRAEDSDFVGYVPAPDGTATCDDVPESDAPPMVTAEDVEQLRRHGPLYVSIAQKARILAALEWVHQQEGR